MTLNQYVTELRLLIDAGHGEDEVMTHRIGGGITAAPTPRTEFLREKKPREQNRYLWHDWSSMKDCQKAEPIILV